ncbi:MAG: hypothetical protein LIO93_08525 [Bacteroidales bacterium]|nr:hypothetical protein [Bacteroidales bacterium]
MAILGRNILKGFFKNGDKPNENNFWDWMDSFFHKTEDKIPITSVTDLAETLNSKANNTALQSETTQRIESDTNLQKQIESLLESISEVAPLTAIRGVTYSSWELQNMDTANFQDGDFYIINDGSSSIRFYLFEKGTDQWVYHSSFYGPLPIVPKVIVKAYKDLSGLMYRDYGYTCIVIADETKNNHTTCYQFNGSWELMHEWIPQEGGGSGENLANTDLCQTDLDRTYTIKNGSLRFFNESTYIPGTSSGLTISNTLLYGSVQDNGGYCDAAISNVGFKVSTINTRWEIGEEGIRIANKTLDFYYDTDHYTMLYKNSGTQKKLGMEMKDDGLYIVSEYQERPADIVMDGSVRFPHVREMIDHASPELLNMCFMITDHQGCAFKVSLQMLAEMLKPYFPQN